MSHESRNTLDLAEIDEVDVEAGCILGCTCTSLELLEDDPDELANLDSNESRVENAT